MNSIEKGDNHGITLKDASSAKGAKPDDLLACDMDLGSLLEKGENPFGNQNGIADDYVFEGTSDNNVFGLNTAANNGDFEVLSTDGEDDVPNLSLAEDRPSSGVEDEPFEIEDLISSSDDEDAKTQASKGKTKDIVPEGLSLEPDQTEQLEETSATAKSTEVTTSSASKLKGKKNKTEGKDSSKKTPKATTSKADGKEKKIKKKKEKTDGGEGKKEKKKTKKKKEKTEGADAEEDAKDTGDTPKPKKKRKKKNADGGEETSKEGKKTKKRKKKDSGGDDGDDNLDAKKRKKAFERRNIRKIIDDQKLDEETIDAQKREQERIQRLQKIQEQILAQQAAMKKQREEEERKRKEEELNTIEKLKQSELQSLLEEEESGGSPPSIIKSGALDSGKETFGAIIVPDRKDVVEILDSSDEEEPPKPKKEVSDSDDDIVILKSEPEDEDEEEDDPANSGSHVNDLLNQADDQGRVLINVGHPDDEKDIFLAPQIAKTVKPHQIGGIRFLYDNLVESLQQYKTSGGFGCILAHSMGLGKTIQMISFIDVFMRNTEAKCVLVIVPINTLQNWLHEFNMWLPTKETIEEKRNEWKQEKERKKQEKLLAKQQKEQQKQQEQFLQQQQHYHQQQQQHYQQQQQYYQQQQQMNPMNNFYPNGPGPCYNPSPMHPNGPPPMHPNGLSHMPPNCPPPMPPNGPPMPPNGPSMPPNGPPMPQNGPPMPPNGPLMPPNGPPMPPNGPPMAPNGPPSMPQSGPSLMPPNEPPQLPPNGPPPMPPNGPPPMPTNGSTPMDTQCNMDKGKDETDSLMDFLTSLTDDPADKEKKEEKKGKEGEEEDEEEEEKDEPDPFENIVTRDFAVHVVNDNLKTNVARGKVVDEWYKKGGVLLMGYEMYRLLTSRRVLNTKPRRSKKKNPSNDPVVIDIDEEDRKAELMSNLQEALIKPGPDLVVCDEGHRIKNSHASISQALKNIKTKRRVVLTGYPLQNNLIEYWCMVDFVRPNYLGSKTEFTNMFERPITNGQCVDSTPQDVRLMKFRAHVLHSLLEGFVQRRGHGVLKVALPHKEEYVLLVRMAPIQRKLYREFMGIIEDGFSEVTNNPLKAFAVCCKIWNHPDVLYKFVVEHKNPLADDDLDIALDDDSRGDMPAGSGKKPKAKKKPAKEVGESLLDKKDSQISYDWAVPVMEDYQRGLLENGGKMLVLLSIIEESLAVGDKLLVFSQSLFTLNLIEEFLSRRKVPIEGCEDKWAKNKNYFRLDGSTSSFEREKLINAFNAPDNDKVQMFLLSTRAGCLGINLIGANRVVVFDASWNPCHDCQAVCRVYRYGQTKKCYVYRLVTDNTMEKKIYDRQINKQGMSDRVVDELNPQNLLSRKQVDVLLQYNDIDMPEVDPEKALTGCTDDVLKAVMTKHHKWITKDPFTHESLLLDKKDEKLTKTEKRLAKQGYEMEKKLNVSYSRPSYASYYPTNNRAMEQPMPRNQPRPVRILYPPNVSSRPVASVRPMMSTPLSIRPTGDLSTPRATLRPGVTIQQVQTTTDITIPGTNTATSAGPAKIPAGENVLVIKTPKGVYIRTGNGKIFAVRTAAGIGNPVGPAPAEGTAGLVTSSPGDSAATVTTANGSASTTATATITSSAAKSSDTPATQTTTSTTTAPVVMDITSPKPSSPAVSAAEESEPDKPETSTGPAAPPAETPENTAASDTDQNVSSPSVAASPRSPALVQSPAKPEQSGPQSPGKSNTTGESNNKFQKSESLLHKMMKTRLTMNDNSSSSSSSNNASTGDIPVSSREKTDVSRSPRKDSSPDTSSLLNSSNPGSAFSQTQSHSQNLAPLANHSQSMPPSNGTNQSMGSGYHPLGSLQNLATGGPAPMGSAPPSSPYMSGGVNPYNMPGQLPWGMGAMGMPPMWMPPMPSGGNDYSNDQGSWWSGSSHSHMGMSGSKDSYPHLSHNDTYNCDSADKQRPKLDSRNGQHSANGLDQMSSLGMTQDQSHVKYGNEGWASSPGHQSLGHGMMGGAMQFPSFSPYGVSHHQPYMSHHSSHINSSATSGGSVSYNYPPMMPERRPMGHVPYSGMMSSYGMNLPGSPHRTRESDHDSAQE